MVRSYQFTKVSVIHLHDLQTKVQYLKLMIYFPLDLRLSSGHHQKSLNQNLSQSQLVLDSLPLTPAMLAICFAAGSLIQLNHNHFGWDHPLDHATRREFLSPFRAFAELNLTSNRATNDSSFYPSDNSFQQIHRASRSQPTASGPTQPPTSRPLSSADEAGPVPKKLRSNVRQPEAVKSSKPNKLTTDDPLKKARARPALTFANIFSSPGRRSQPTSSHRTAAGTGKSNNPPVNPNVATRRSTRLLSGSGTKQPHSSKVSTSQRP